MLPGDLELGSFSLLYLSRHLCLIQQGTKLWIDSVVPVDPLNRTEVIASTNAIKKDQHP